MKNKLMILTLSLLAMAFNLSASHDESVQIPKSEYEQMVARLAELEAQEFQASNENYLDAIQRAKPADDARLKLEAQKRAKEERNAAIKAFFVNKFNAIDNTVQDIYQPALRLPATIKSSTNKFMQEHPVSQDHVKGAYVGVWVAILVAMIRSAINKN
jgi:hypothetical protein